MGRWNELDALAESACSRLGKVDVLVNNVGTHPLYESLVDFGEDLYEKVPAAKLEGPLRLTALVGDRTSKGDGGSIINVSSTAALRPSPFELPCSAAKAGVNASTRGFARAFGPKARAHCIVAASFLADISKAWGLEAFEKQAKPTMALGRGGGPEEAVGAAPRPAANPAARARLW